MLLFLNVSENCNCSMSAELFKQVKKPNKCTGVRVLLSTRALVSQQVVRAFYDLYT